MAKKTPAVEAAAGVSHMKVRLHLEPDGSLSNKRLELYAIMRVEEVHDGALPAYMATGSSGTGRGSRPNGNYFAAINRHPAFVQRLETLMAEKAELAERGTIWGELEWQARQNYRRAAATNDTNKCLEATSMLLKIAVKGQPIDDGKKPGRVGAPVVESTPDREPEVEGEISPTRRRLLER